METEQIIVGKYGGYTHPLYVPTCISYQPIPFSQIEIEYGRLYIPADKIAPFVTELIEMARVLGVTGQEKGND